MLAFFIGISLGSCMTFFATVIFYRLLGAEWVYLTAAEGVFSTGFFVVLLVAFKMRKESFYQVPPPTGRGMEN